MHYLTLAHTRAAALYSLPLLVVVASRWLLGLRCHNEKILSRMDISMKERCGKSTASMAQF